MDDAGVRITPPMASIVAGPPAVTILHVTSAGKRAIIRKLMCTNRGLANAFLRIGWVDNIAAFNQAWPDILIPAGADIEINEADLPIRGNAPEGFELDATVGAGALGIIYAQASAAAAVPNDVQVMVEIEEI